MYQSFFLQSKRMSSSKPLAVVKGDKFESLIRYILSDSIIDDRYKVFFCVCLSGGLRVNEGLALKKSDFFEEDGALYFRVGVLKKRRKDERLCRVHPLAQDKVRTFLENKIGVLFPWTSRTCLRKIKKFLPVEGICNHSLRHSAISYLLFEERMSAEKAAKLVHVSPKIIEYYLHLDEKAVLREMFNKKAS